MSLVKGLSYVDLPVSPDQLKETAAFYTDALGFQVIPRPTSEAETDDGIWLQNFEASICLHLSLTKPEGGSITFVSEGLEKLTRVFDQRSMHFTKSTSGERLIKIVTKDPAGNTLTFSSQSSPFSSSFLPLVDGGHNPTEQSYFDAIQLADRRVEQLLQSQQSQAAKSRKRIGVLTSGGDSAGMNAAVRAVVRGGIFRNCDVFAIREGYQGMVEGGDNNIVQLNWKDVSGILQEGGTIIGTARSKEMRTREGRLKAVYNLISRSIDAIVVIGGDGSLTGANLLRKEWPDLVKELLTSGKITQEKADAHPVFAVVGMVGSIDNDMCGTSMTIGADTALHRAVEAIDSLSSTAASHQRAFVVEIMGRNCGWLTLYVALACGADWMLIPEAPSMNDDWETEMCTSLQLHKELKKRRIIVVVSEGAIDKHGKPIKSEYVKSVIENRLKIETRTTVLGHVQRGGKPSAFDRIIPTLQGVDAVEAILAMTVDSPAPLIGINENKVTRKPLVECVEQTQAVTKAMADLNFERATSLRGKEFVEAVDTFREVSAALDLQTAEKSESTSKIRIGIIHVGAPAGGANAATRAIVRLAISRGYTALGIHNSFDGLANGEVDELEWLTVDGWSMRGGSELGTNRSTPREDYGMVAFNMQKFSIHGLVIIGGFEGFVAAKELLENRDKYPQFCIPIVHLPATISNNVTGTEFTLGSDTAVNIIIEAIDELKQSASSSKRRVFVLETMGGQCGFLAAASSLGGGASRCYIPEEGISFSNLAEDLIQLKEKFHASEERGTGRVFVRCENSSPTYTTEFVASLLDEEGKKVKLWDAKTANLGHLQQGGTPSPLDRVRGVRLASRCLSFLEHQIKESQSRKRAPLFDKHAPMNSLSVYTTTTESVCVIGYTGDSITLSPITKLVPLTDFKLRRPKEQWWRSFSPLIRMLAGYEDGK